MREHRTSELAPRDGRTPPRAAALCFRGEQARVEWQRKRTLLSREARDPAQRDKAVSEAIEAMAERIEKRQASCG